MNRSLEVLASLDQIMEKKNNLVPYFQYEVRFTPILDFGSSVRTVLTPYVKLTKRVGIDNRGQNNEAINLYMDDDFYQIVCLWDRLVIRSEGMLDTFKGKSSLVKSPFFDILGKISELKEFGKVTNHLLAVNLVNINGLSEEKNKEKFREDWINPHVKTVLGQCDYAITLDNRKEGFEDCIEFGPYVGLKDLEDRKRKPKNEELCELLKAGGQMSQIKVFRSPDSVNFKEYEKLLDLASGFHESTWSISK